MAYAVGETIYIVPILLDLSLLSQLLAILALAIPYLLDVSKTVLGTLCAMWLFQEYVDESR